MYEPELGQFAFGNAWATYALEDDTYAKLLYGLSERICGEHDSPGYATDFENDVFVMRRYWWGDCDTNCTEDKHAPTCRVVLPNFEHKPSGLHVHWYKYIGRGMSANRPVTPEEFAEIIAQCVDSVDERIEK